MRGLWLFLRCAVILTVAASSSAATFTVTTPADAGPGSLRQAILDANATAGTDEIRFAAGGGLFGSAPPVITDPVDIDGALPPGLAVVRGAGVLRFGTGSTGSTLRNTFVLMDLAIDTGVSGITLTGNRFDRIVRIAGDGNRVEENEFLEGIEVEFASGNQIGSEGHGNTFIPRVVDTGLSMHHCVCTAGTAILLRSAPTLVEGNLFDFRQNCFIPSPQNDCAYYRPIRVVQGTPSAGGSRIRGNIIHSSSPCGVTVEGVNGVEILANPVFRRDICLSGGANHDQPAPVLLSATWIPGVLRVIGTLSSTANTPFTVELYGVLSGRAKEHLGAFEVVTASDGVANFVLDLPWTNGLLYQSQIVATATNTVTQETSPFSAAVDRVNLPGNDVPTLSTWALIILAIGLLAAAALRV